MYYNVIFSGITSAQCRQYKINLSNIFTVITLLYCNIKKSNHFNFQNYII